MQRLRAQYSTVDPPNWGHEAGLGSHAVMLATAVRCPLILWLPCMHQDLTQPCCRVGADDDEVMVGVLSEQELAAVNVPDLEYK